MTLALLIVVLAQADAGTSETVDAVDVQSHASPKATVDGMVATDVLYANSLNRNPTPPVEAPELTSAELGIRALVSATAISRHLHLDVDYQGRQPIAGNVKNADIHLLNRAELSADFLDKLLYVGVGRFLAPSAVMLPVDGGRVVVHFRALELQVFGGRRAITSTRSGNVELSTFLPAVGGMAAVRFERVQAEAAVSFAGDQVPLPDGSQQSYNQLSSYARVTARPTDWLNAGGELALAQRATYVLGPTWSSAELRTRTADVFYAYVFADLRPHATVRVTYDFHFQNAALYRSEPAAVNDVLFVPQFMDNRLRIRWRPFGLGWLGPDVRWRVRPDRHEWRFGGRADLAPSWARGFCLRAHYMYELMARGVELPSDRSYWSASLGWRWSGLDLSAGVNNVQRSNLPLSSRVYTPYDDTPTQPVDLSPFMLEAQRTAFVRLFYSSDVFFAGLDFEQSLTDERERRVFAQVGARLEKVW